MKALHRLTPFLIAASVLPAHDFYILPNAFTTSPEARIIVALQNGDSFPESDVSPLMKRLRDVGLHSSNGKVAIGRLKLDGNRIVGRVQAPASAGSLILAARTAPNFIELAPDKALEYFKEEGLDEVIEWRSQHGEASKPSRERYSKYAKSLLISDRSDGFYKTAVGFPIEILPEADPSSVHPGGSLPVRIVFRDNPAAGLQLEAAWAASGVSHTRIVGRTDPEGRIEVPIGAPGKWRLHSLKMDRCAEPTVADWESYWASLTFEIR